MAMHHGSRISKRASYQRQLANFNKSYKGGDCSVNALVSAIWRLLQPWVEYDDGVTLTILSLKV